MLDQRIAERPEDGGKRAIDEDRKKNSDEWRQRKRHLIDAHQPKAPSSAAVMRQSWWSSTLLLLLLLGMLGAGCWTLTMHHSTLLCIHNPLLTYIGFP